MSRPTKEVRTFYDARTGQSYRVNVRTGIVCGVNGEYPDLTTEARVRSAVMKRIKAGNAARLKDQAMKDVGMVKVRGNMGGTFYE